jgi:UDP-3-O-[3-hydroxymyristoyl] glucosamine N-acyltransferase
VEYIQFLKKLKISDLVAIAVEILGSKNELEVITFNKTFESVKGISDGRYAANRTLCFLDRQPSQGVVEQVKESFIITNREIAQNLDCHRLLIVDDPRALFIDLLHRLQLSPGFSYFTSSVDEKPYIHPDSEVHAHAVIEEGVYIGTGTRIAAGCVIKQGTRIGDNVIIHENTVIGCDGIALYKAHDGRILRFPHLAGVIIEDDVEIGASCVIPRGVLTSSFIGGESVIGNLSNLGHAVKVGSNVWMSVGCLIGGNSTIGERSTFGMGVSIRDNLTIGADCSIGMGSVVVKDATDGSSLFGNPAKKMRTINAGPLR